MRNLLNMKIKVGDLVHENYIAKYIKKRVYVLSSELMCLIHQFIQRLDLLLKQYLIVKLIIFIAKN